MTVFARFVYASDKPALRVHIWDIFDEANLEAKDFVCFFDKVYEKFEDIFFEHGFESYVEELS